MPITQISGAFFQCQSTVSQIRLCIWNENDSVQNYILEQTAQTAGGEQFVKESEFGEGSWVRQTRYFMNTMGYFFKQISLQIFPAHTELVGLKDLVYKCVL